eukprot:m.868590 g.868590  ORF g.868590 m.868590 type:complete len:99 (+) comp23563_c2_seq11:202-498(+)
MSECHIVSEWDGSLVRLPVPLRNTCCACLTSCWGVVYADASALAGDAASDTDYVDGRDIEDLEFGWTMERFHRKISDNRKKTKKNVDPAQAVTAIQLL